MKKVLGTILPVCLTSLLFLGGQGFAAEAGHLRETISLNFDWRFRRQVAPGSAIEWQFRDAWKPEYDDSEWSKVFVPHSWDQTAHSPWVALDHWRGIGWYRKSFTIPQSAAGKKIFLGFEAVAQVAKVWLNGVEVGDHVGGFTGFVLDITDAANPGAENLLVVRDDNTNSPDIPPGNESNVSAYGGIYRDVWLHITDTTYIPYCGIGITTPEVTKSRSSVRVRTKVTNAGRSSSEIKLASVVIARNGNVVAESIQERKAAANDTVEFDQQDLVVERPDLWSPDHPNLYALRSRVYRDGALVDEVSTRFGIRVMGYVAGKGYTINGEFINLHGVNRRQDYGYLADALPDAMSRHDMEIIKELGANFVRTAHYVQDKSILEAADELGILIWEEIPNIKIYDYSPTAARNEDVRYTRKYIDNCLHAMEEMIQRDRNHPSIIIWGIGDDLTGYPYLEDLKEIADKAHELDPTRWTAGRVYPLLTDVRDPTNGRYFDFYQLSKQHPDWKWLWNEWGAFVNERGVIIEPSTDVGRRDTGNVDEYRRTAIASELSGAIFQEASWIKFEAIPWMATSKWVMFDPGSPATNRTKGIFYYYGPPESRPWGTRFTGGDYRGLSDMWRIPKASYWFVKAQWTETPFVYIVGHWTWPGAKGKPKMVRIYSTCDEVELFLNGKSLGKKKPEATENLIAEWNSYGMWEPRFPLPEDIKLRHGPFIWKNVPYEPGVLRAIGTKNGKQYADERKTAGEPYQIILKPDRDTIAAGGRDAVRVVAVIADKDGVMMPSANPWLTFRADGPGSLLGTRVMDAVWGMAAINVLSQTGAGNIVITASSRGLKDGKCVIRSGPAN